MKALIGDRDAIVEVVRYINHKNGFSISYLDSIGNETGLMYSVSHNIKLLEDTDDEIDSFKGGCDE